MKLNKVIFMKKAITVLLIVLSAFLSGCGAKSNFNTNYNSNSLDREFDSSATVFHDTQSTENTDNTKIINGQVYSKTDITIPEPDYQIWNIENNSTLSKVFIGENQNVIYEFTAPITGRYCFTLKHNNDSKKYSVEIRNKDDNKRVDGEESRETNVSFYPVLTQGQCYLLQLSQIHGKPNCEVSVQFPNPKRQVTDNLAKGSFIFTNQIEEWTYVPTVDGRYVFELSASKANYKYKFILKDEKDVSQIETNYSYSKNSENAYFCELNKDESYTLFLEYNGEIPEDDKLGYSINIHKPIESIQVTDNKISGEFTYNKQQAIYFFTPNETAEYHFEYSDNNEPMKYEINIKNSNNGDCGKTDNHDRHHYNCELKKDEKYQFIITQQDEFGIYNIDIVKTEQE